MSEEDALAEIVVEKYAQAKGLDVEEAKKKYLPILKAKDKSKFDKVSESLMKACSVLGAIKEAGEGAGEPTRDMLSALATSLVSTAITGGAEGDPVDEGVKDSVRYIAKLKAIEQAFGSSDVEALKKEIADLKDMITNQKKAEELQEVIAQMQMLIQPLQERLEKLEAGNKGGEKPDPDELFKEIGEITEKAKTWLQKAGYQVEMPKALTKEAVQEMLKAERKKWEEEHNLEKETKLEETKINAAVKVIEKAIDRVMTPFEPIIREAVENAIMRRVQTQQPQTPQTPGAPQPVEVPQQPQLVNPVEQWGPEPSPVFGFERKKPPKTGEK